ncbi:MAG TPA: hypothetical protein VI542_38135 [Candidatus Tectomicrobia bacterium]
MSGTIELRIIVLISEADEADGVWMQGLAREWAAALHDPREDIYTLEDGKPIDAAQWNLPGQFPVW